MTIIPFTSKEKKYSKKLKDPMEMLSPITEALTYFKTFSGEVFLIYCDGSVLSDDKRLKSLASDIQFLRELEISVFVVHGGGDYLANALDRFQILNKNQNDPKQKLRDTIDLLEMIMSGSLNQKIVSIINSQGGKAIGISGKDGNLMIAQSLSKVTSAFEMNMSSLLDLRLMGEPHTTNTELLISMEELDVTVIISPVTADEEGNTFMIDPIAFSAVVASSLQVIKYIVLTDYEGLTKKQDEIIPSVTQNQAKKWIATNKPGPELEHIINNCCCAIENGIDTAHIIDSNIPNALLLEVFSEKGIGTRITNNNKN